MRTDTITAIARDLVLETSRAFCKAQADPERWELTTAAIQDGIVAEIAKRAGLIDVVLAVLKKHGMHEYKQPL